MIELTGKYNTAKVFTEDQSIWDSAIPQIQHLLDLPFTAGSQIRVMPDCHAGMGCTVGMTMTLTDKVVPNLIGVDISCGMHVALIQDKRIDFNQFDKAVHQSIPSGFSVRSTPHHYNEEIDLSLLRCAKHVDINRATLSIGTLGGGNHFIELGQDDDNQLYLIIHSGSRNLGKNVCEHYQNHAADTLGRTGEKADRVLAYLEGANLDDYLFDMAIIQRYADLNRRAIVRDLSKQVKFKIKEEFAVIHNYIDLDAKIIRKGAVSAQKGERMLVPMNMRDGSLFCEGKGNADWNYSAPHGSGRLMSRAAAKQSITLTEYEKIMKGIFSTTVSRATIDEAPFAYKPMQQIIDNSSDTMEIIKVIKPLYNFKAGQD
jgi:RNA-splicing ligase RtcB